MTDTSLEAAASSLLKLSQPIDATPAVETKPENQQEIVEEQVEETQEQVEEESTEAEKVIIDYNGQQLEVDSEELRKGYIEYLKGESRINNYTKKFQEVAEKSKQVEAKASELEKNFAIVKEYEARLDILDKVIETPPIDPRNLKVLLDQGDTEEYLKQKTQYDDWLNRKHALYQERNHLNDLMSRKEAEVIIAKQAREREILQEKYPEVLAKDNSDKLNKFLLSYEFTQQDINKMDDHRLFILADKARKYDEFVAGKGKMATKVVTIPKVIKKGAPQTMSTPQMAEQKKAWDRFNQSHSLTDVAELLLQKSKNKTS